MNPAAYYLSSLETNIPYVPVGIDMPDGKKWDQNNLNTSVYSDGTPIPRPTTGTVWSTLTTGAYRFYNNDSSNAILYGRLYNWYAVNGIDGSGTTKDIAPAGWRVATLDDWKGLANSYIANSATQNSLASGYLKEPTLNYWQPSNSILTPYSGFNARGGGYVGGVGSSTGMYTNGYWWPFGEVDSQHISMTYNGTILGYGTSAVPNRGYSVRLIKKDIEIPGFTTTLGTILAKSVSTGGFIPTTYSEVPSEVGIAWGTLANPNIIANNSIVYTSPYSLGSYSINLPGLSANTTYHIRAYAKLTGGTSYTILDTSFTTRDGVASLTTNTVTDIVGSTATCGGNITEDGGDTITARGVCWNTASSPTITNFKTIDGSGTGSFTSSITGLSSAETYYVRAYATNSVTTTYGNEQVFQAAIVTGLILDVFPSAHHAYSLRKLRTLYAGYCLRVRRTVGATTVIVDVPFDTTTNEVALTSLISLPPVSGTTTATTLGQFAAIAGYGTADPGVPANQNIFVQIWYDQSGNGKNLIQNTVGQQPRIVSSATADLEKSGGKVAVRFVKSSSNNFSIADTTANKNNMSSFWAGQFASGTGSQIGYLLSAVGNFYFPYQTSTQVLAGYGANTIQLDSSPSTNRKLYELISPQPGSSTLAQAWTNGTAKGTSALISGAISNIQVGTGSANYFDGWIHEVIGWQTNASRIGKETNINTYWTIFP